MRSQGWRACVAPSLVASGSPPSRRRAARDARRSWLQRRCGMKTPHGGASDLGIELCKLTCACVLPQRQCARRCTDSRSVHAHRSRAHPGKLANPQHDRPVANLPGTTVYHRWRLPGRAQAASAAARHGHAVASGHRFLRCQATTQISHHIAPHRPVRIFVSGRLIQPNCG